jgi:two-component sensor histidine kinase
MDQLLRRNYLINLISILGASILALVIFYIPLRTALISEAESRIERAMEIQTLRAQNVLITIDRSVKALSSRSAIRFAMADYLQGLLSLEELQDFVQLRYVDGAQVVEGVLATRRYLTDGTVIGYYNNPEYDYLHTSDIDPTERAFFLPSFWDNFFLPPSTNSLETNQLEIFLSPAIDVTGLSLVFIATNPILEQGQILGYDQVLVQKESFSDILPTELTQLQIISNHNQPDIENLTSMVQADIGYGMLLLAKPSLQLYSQARRQALQSIVLYTLMLFILISGLVYVTVVKFVRNIITNYRQANEKLSQALETKELLLKEVHHRIKNNMNTISSLLSIQAEMTKDEQTVEVLETSVHRLQSLSILYDRLYQQCDFLHMDIREYLLLLCNEIHSIFPNCEKVTLDLQIESGKLKARQLSTIGIVVNELITNSMKHGFPHGKSGTISIHTIFDVPSVPEPESSNLPRNLIMTYMDSGIGCNFDQPETNWSGSKRITPNFGLQLINILIRQLRGNIVTNDSIDQKGCSWTITIPLS